MTRRDDASDSIGEIEDDDAVLRLRPFPVLFLHRDQPAPTGREIEIRVARAGERPAERPLSLRAKPLDPGLLAEQITACLS